MRSRIPGRLAAAAAAAAITASAVPASAEEAPPPVPRTYSVDGCTDALNLLTPLLGLLPDRPNLNAAVCLTEPEQEPGEAQTGTVEGTYMSRDGWTVEDDTLMGLPVGWPQGLTVKVPTLNDGLYTYTSGR